LKNLGDPRRSAIVLSPIICRKFLGSNVLSAVCARDSFLRLIYFTTLQQTARYLLLIARCLHLADRPGEVISTDEIAQFDSRAVSGSRRSRALFRWRATERLRFLGWLQSTPDTPQPFSPASPAWFRNVLART